MNWPEFSPSTYFDVAEWKARFRMFQTQMRTIRAHPAFTGSSFAEIANVLLGLPTNETSALKSEFEQEVSRLLFNDPTISLSELSRLLQVFFF